MYFAARYPARTFPCQRLALAVADEDLERENETKTSSVHFLRFEFAQAMISAFPASAVSVGIDLPAYGYAIEALPDDQRAALAQDFGPG